jgi:signal transduction histidine kinase
MQRWLTRMYERHGERYVWSVVAMAYVVALLSVGLALFLGARFYGLSVAQFGRSVAITAALEVVLLAGATWSVRRELSLILDWVERDRSRPAEVALAVQTGPRRACVASLVGNLFASLPVGAFSVLDQAHRLTALGAAAVYCGAVFILLYSFLISWYWLEVMTRPVWKDLASTAPATANRVHGRPIGLGVRLLVGLLPATTLAAFFAAALESKRGLGTSGLLRAFAIAIGATTMLVSVLVVLVVVFVLDPIRDLTRAARAVGAGDLDAQVAVTSTDELGALAESFNEMVSGLRERKGLRERNAELNAELIASRTRIVAASDAARRRLERDLHDGAQQRLVLIGLKLGLAKRLVASDAIAAERSIDELRLELRCALAELRDLAHGIYPAVLENEGLPAALREAAERAATPTVVDCDGAGRYPPELEAAVYFCCLEALQNAAKHAGPRASVAVRIAQRDGALRFEVADDGAGFDARNGAVESAGLQNMTDRVGALGGTLRIDSAPGNGATITGTVPVA